MRSTRPSLDDRRPRLCNHIANLRAVDNAAGFAIAHALLSSARTGTPVEQIADWQSVAGLRICPRRRPFDLPERLDLSAELSSILADVKES